MMSVEQWKHVQLYVLRETRQPYDSRQAIRLVINSMAVGKYGINGV